MLEDSEWGPTVVHNTQPQQQTRGASEGSVRTEGDADHEARVSAAFGSLELSADAPLAEAANDSAARRREESGAEGEAEAARQDRLAQMGKSTAQCLDSSRPHVSVLC